MTEVEQLQRDNESLQHRNDLLLQRSVDAEAAVAAFARGNADAAVIEESAPPVLVYGPGQELRRSERLLRAIFDSTLDAILLVDDRGQYVDANPAACELFGLSREQLVGRTIVDFAAPGHDAKSAYDTLLRDGQMRGQFPLRRPDGSERILEYSAVANVGPGLHLSVLRDISARVATEEALRSSEARFRALIEKSAEAISLTAADGTTRYITHSVSRLLGWTLEELETHAARDQVVPEDRSRIANELAHLAQSGERDLSMEFRVHHRDGSTRWIEASGTNLLDDPDVRAIVGNYRDITARKLAEDALRQSGALLEEAQAIAHVGSWTSGVGGADEIKWSRECYRIFGLPDGAAITVETFFSCVHPADRERVREASRHAVDHDEPYDIEHRVQLPDGRVRWVHERAIVERTAATGRAQIIGTVQDITDRRAATEALKTSEERYRRIVENTSDGVWMYDEQAITTFMNGRMAGMLGYAVDEAVGQSIYAFMDESKRAAAKERALRRQHGTPENGEAELRRKDGAALWVSFRANALVDLDGRFEAGLVLVTDISTQRRADEARARLAAIVDSSDDAILSANVDGTVTSWNAGAEKLYQYSADEMLGKSIFQLCSPAGLGDQRRILECAAGGEAVRQHETERRRKDGSAVQVALTISPVRDAAGNVIGVSKIVRDLTVPRQIEAALHRSEEQFRQAQKMEAVGRLAGGIAHDFNNLLSVILSYSSLVLEELKVGDPMRADIEQIAMAGNRATELTRQLLAFSRQQILQPRVVDLAQIVLGMKPMLRRLLGEDIELTTLVAPELGRVLADPGQLEQVLMNLAVNARDAMPDGGKLTIETVNVNLNAPYVGAHFGVALGDYVMLAISDTGVGMDAATRARIFEPFFTTKEKGKGTGLGLSTVFGIVEQSGGHVGVYSEPGRGCTFKVYLPRTDRVAEFTPSMAPASLLRGSETILLVEDEEQVRTVACAILRRNGYNVLECSNGGEAFLISQDFGATIHLLFTDVVMPRMSGRRLVEQLTPRRPKMKVLFASGYTDDAIVHHGVLDAGVAFLQKPFTPDALLRKVREVLAGA